MERKDEGARGKEGRKKKLAVQKKARGLSEKTKRKGGKLPKD